jgi:hypothetical protein
MVSVPPLLSHQLIVIEFLLAENRLLKDRLRGKRILWSALIRAAGMWISDACRREPTLAYKHMLPLARAFVGVASDVLRVIVSFLRSSSAIPAENLVLRKQLASYVERGIKRRRVDHATRISLALF